MEVLYHIRPYFWGDIPLHSPYIGLIYGRYLHFRILKFPLITITLWTARNLSIFTVERWPGQIGQAMVRDCNADPARMPLLISLCDLGMIPSGKLT